MRNIYLANEKKEREKKLTHNNGEAQWCQGSMEDLNDLRHVRARVTAIVGVRAIAHGHVVGPRANVLLRLSGESERERM